MDKPTIGERYYTQVTESINSIVELATRVDERVQGMIKKQQTLEDKIDNQLNSFNELNTKVKILESQTGISFHDEIRKMSDDLRKMEIKLNSLENSSSSQEGRWKTIFGFMIQLTWVIVAAAILYKLGIQAPAVP